MIEACLGHAHPFRTTGAAGVIVARRVPFPRRHSDLAARSRRTKPIRGFSKVCTAWLAAFLGRLLVRKPMKPTGIISISTCFHASAAAIASRPPFSTCLGTHVCATALGPVESHRAKPAGKANPSRRDLPKLTWFGVVTPRICQHVLRRRSWNQIQFPQTGSCVLRLNRPSTAVWGCERVPYPLRDLDECLTKSSSSLQCKRGGAVWT